MPWSSEITLTSVSIAVILSVLSKNCHLSSVNKSSIFSNSGFSKLISKQKSLSSLPKISIKSFSKSSSASALSLKTLSQKFFAFSGDGSFELFISE